MKKLKTKWKLVLALCLTVLAMGGIGIAYVIAANDIKITFNRGVDIQFEDAYTPYDVFVGLTGKDEDGLQDYTKIEYNSSNERIFEIAGLINDDKSILRIVPKAAGIANLEGKYLLSVTDGVGNYSKVFTGKVTVPLQIDIGGDEKITTTVSNPPVTIFTNGTIYNALTWSYSNSGVVDVTSDHTTFETATVTGLGGGITTVTGTTQDGLTASFDVEVAIEVEQQTFIVEPMQSVSVLEYTNINNPQAVYWKIDPDANGNVIATVNNGVVQGLKTGVTTLYISTDPNFDPAKTQEVKITIPFGWGNTINTINVGDEFKLTTSMNDAEITWSTSNKDIVSLSVANGSPDGTIIGVSEGVATIFATRVYTDVDGTLKTETIQTTVNVVDYFGISRNEVTISKGDVFPLTALASNTSAAISWAVSDNSIVDFATVTDKNNVTEQFKGLKKGTTTIVVTQNVDGVIKSAICTVTVLEPVGSLRIEPDDVMFSKGSTYDLKLYFEPLNADNQNVKWSSDNPAVAEVVSGDALGATIRGVSGGTATISAVSEDGLYIAYCTVKVTLPVEKIELNMHNVNIDMATGYYQLTYTVYPISDGVNQEVVWSSSNTDVLTVDQKGLVTFVSPGYATVYCQTMDKTYNYAEGAPFDLCEFYIKKPVTDIKLNHTNESIAIGDTLLFTAAITPNDASNKNVIWSSSNPKVATIDQEGYMKAVGSGYAAILCKSESDGITAVCNVYVRQPVTEVQLSATNMTVRKGSDFYLSATVLPENADNKNISWVTSDPRIATVEPDGKVTTHATGIVTISAVAEDNGVTGYCVVTVTEPVDGITLNSTAERMLVGTKFLIIPTVTPIDATNKAVTYKSSDPNVATVDEDGVVTAVQGGECVITVTTVERGLIASCNITVIEKVESISLNKTNTYLNINNILQLVATIDNDTATDKRLVWTSSNSEIASVNQYGQVTGLKVGTTVITVTAVDGGGASASCVVKVIEPVRQIVLDKTEETIYVGDSLKINATVLPSNATVKTLKWTSSDPTVASVDEDGEVFGLKPGKVKITATSTDDNEIKAYCTVYVKASVDATKIRINASRVLMLAGKGRQLQATIYPTSTNENILWESSDTSIITVNKGYISAVGVGNCTVLAYSSRSGVSTSIDVFSMALSKTKLTVEQYDKFQLYVDGAPDDERVSFRTSNPRVATISANGEVIARQEGTTTVTATVDGKTMTCTILVVKIEDKPDNR